MKFIVTSLIILASWSVNALEAPPANCHPLSVSTTTLLLPKSPPRIVLISNLSDLDLWVTHPIAEPNASAGWSSRLQPKHWSALALNETSFELGCIESKPGHEQQVSCAGVLMACEWPGITGKESQKTPYWAAENMPLPELLAHLNQRGFNLSEPTSSLKKGQP